MYMSVNQQSKNGIKCFLTTYSIRRGVRFTAGYKQCCMGWSAGVECGCV